MSDRAKSLTAEGLDRTDRRLDGLTAKLWGLIVLAVSMGLPGVYAVAQFTTRLDVKQLIAERHELDARLSARDDEEARRLRGELEQLRSELVLQRVEITRLSTAVDALTEQTRKLEPRRRR